MESSSRRAFFAGRRPPQTPWEQFVRRLRRGVAGDMLDFGLYQDKGSARLTPAQAGDMRLARSLCHEFGVVLALSGVSQADSLNGQSVLWVELDGSMAGCQPIPEQSGKWFVRPGTLLSELVDVGLGQFAQQPGYLTIAAWIADRTLCAWAPGESFRSGLLHASVLMADGTAAVFGPFGTQNRLPLTTSTQQKLVPALFSLASGEPALEFTRMPHWPARYRLDALRPQPGNDVNLAHLFLGHGGDLGWIEWLVFEVRPVLPCVDWAQAYTSRPPVDEGQAVWHQAFELDKKVKALFDPHKIFPDPGQDL